MKYLLAKGREDLLAPLSDARVLLAFDYDGTLAPIVDVRDRARMRVRTSQLLARLCERYPCAVISGRSRRDVRARLAGARVKYVIGNHGLEPGGDLARSAREVSRALPQLRAALAPIRGLEIEDKRYSLALHYRMVHHKRRARAAIAEVIARLSTPLRTIGGKDVVNAVPRSAPHKGDALAALQARERASVALYVGDDLTDEDVFELERPDVIGVRIGRSRSSSAQFFLHDQAEIDRLLAKLLALRS
jgi:trehalose 6-phosphate phosphatase